MEDTGRKMVENRITWIDALKGVAIISVVLGHALLGYTEISAFPKSQENMQILRNWIYSWHMPLFIAISGCTFGLAYRSSNTVKIPQIRKQIINLILIFLIFQVTLCGSKIVFSVFVDNKMSVATALVNIFLPDTLMWYLWVLTIYYILISVFSCKVVESRFALLGMIFISVLGRTIGEKYGARICLRELLYCTPFFVEGITIGKSIKASRKLKLKNEITLISIVMV